MKRFVALLLSATVPAVSAICAEDHLQRGELPWGNDHLFLRYDKEIRRVLWRAWEADVVLRTVHFPPFHTEWIVGIVRRPGGYKAFLLEPTAQVWAALQNPDNPKKELASIHARYYERELSEAFSERLAAIFRRVLSDRRNYREDRRRIIVTDSSSFTYMVRYQPGEYFVAYTESEEHTPSAVLFDVSSSLYLFVRGKIDVTNKKWLRMTPRGSQLALEHSIRDAEAKLGMTRRSNQALQPTTSRRG